MGRARHGFRSAGALFVLASSALFSLAGCALIGPQPGPATVPSGSVPPVVGAPVGPSPESAISGPGGAVVAPPSSAAGVAILYSGEASAQVEIADRIASGLDASATAVHRIDLDRLDIGTPVDTGVEWDVSTLAAIGPEALDVARQRFLGADIVYCQVLDPDADDDATRVLRGVAPLPPLALQFSAWSTVDPKLERIGVITSSSFAATIAEAAQAADGIGAELDHRISTSDRETLYIFRRLAPEIDGLWLAPDSSVLSATVISEMLSLAAELEISVLVFSEGLLERGGLLSVGAPAEEVAATVVAAVKAMRSGQGSSLPAEMPLDAGFVHVNASVAAALGLPMTTPARWIIHE
jgi:hypothetical protein